MTTHSQTALDEAEEIRKLVLWEEGEDETLAAIADKLAAVRAESAGLVEVAPAIEQLTNHQQQADMDGCMVTVSRQALEEVLLALAKATQP